MNFLVIFQILVNLSIVFSSFYRVLDQNQAWQWDAAFDYADPDDGGVSATTDYPASTKPSTTKHSTTKRPTVGPERVLSQVNKIVESVQGGHVYGIVDESLGIRNTSSVQNLVRGILRTVFCGPLATLLNLCPRQQGTNPTPPEPQSSQPASSKQNLPTAATGALRPVSSDKTSQSQENKPASTQQLLPIGSYL